MVPMSPLTAQDGYVSSTEFDSIPQVGSGRKGWSSTAQAPSSMFSI